MRFFKTASVVVDDFDIFRPLFCPTKTNAPLIVYANAVNALLVTAQSFQAIAGRYEEIRQRLCGVQHGELSFNDVLNRPKAPRAFAKVDGLGVTAPK